MSITTIVMIAFGVGIGFFAVGALLLALLWKCGIVRRLDMCEEEQILFVCVWPIELLIVIPTRLLIQAGSAGPACKEVTKRLQRVKLVQ